MSQSKELTEFYQAYRDWLDAGAPENEAFSGDFGLCALTYSYARSIRKSFEFAANLEMEMNLQFQTEIPGMREDFPFNPKQGSYTDETCEVRCHLNKMRVKWVRDHAAI